MDRSGFAQPVLERSTSLTTIDCTELAKRLMDPEDEAAWAIVNDRYSPAVRGFARTFGLGHHDADDACQNALAAFAATVRAGRYDRRRGRLRDLLFAIARNKALDIRRALVRQPLQVMGDSRATDFFDRAPSAEDMSSAWEEEWRSAVYRQCLVEAKAHFTSETYSVFYMRAIDDVPTSEVAERTGKTVNAVDLTTYRVREYLRQIRPQIEQLF